VNTSNFALMIGTATFSFEGIGLVIPIAESMERPEKFPLVVSLGTIIVCVIYIVVGSMSYLAYGDQIQAAVVYNFPPSNPLTITVQLLYSVAIILTQVLSKRESGVWKTHAPELFLESRLCYSLRSKSSRMVSFKSALQGLKIIVCAG
jgi:amino acid permease